MHSLQAGQNVQNRYIWLPLLLLTPDGGVARDDFSKILRGGQRMANVYKKLR